MKNYEIHSILRKKRGRKFAILRTFELHEHVVPRSNMLDVEEASS